MSQQDSRPVLMVNEASIERPESTLTYASPLDFERAIFRFIGWLSMIIALATLLLLTFEVFHLRGPTLPKWWHTLAPRQVGAFDSVVLNEMWRDGVAPLAHRLLALLLLAGGIGCTRRHVRTRWWMISYAVLAILVEITSLIAHLQYAHWWIYYSYSRSGTGAIEVWTLRILHVLADRWPHFVLPIVILWLMTRPRVGELFAKHRG